jgi:hypothetical protein
VVELITTGPLLIILFLCPHPLQHDVGIFLLSEVQTEQPAATAFKHKNDKTLKVEKCPLILSAMQKRPKSHALYVSMTEFYILDI